MSKPLDGIRSATERSDESPSRLKPNFWEDNKLAKTWRNWTCIYLLLVIIPITVAVKNDFRLSQLNDMGKVAVVLSGIVLSIAPTYYWWWLSVDFEKWIITRTPSAGQKETDFKKQIDFERSYFSINRDHARAIWAVVVATFAAFLIKAH